MDLYFRGMVSFNKGLTPEYLSQARDFFERSLALDPGNISAQVGAAAVHVMAANTYQTDDQTVRLASAEEALMGVLQTSGGGRHFRVPFDRFQCVAVPFPSQPF
jgi:hypothetical protein